MSAALRAPGLASLGIAHGFGTREAPVPAGLRRPRQVHGARVLRVEEPGPELLAEADAVLCRVPGLPVGVVTADCIPILAASRSGRVVAAIHAGWRGLAAGVIGQALAALRAAAAGEELVAALGPHVGPCCYEVDEPVLRALDGCFPELRARATRRSRRGHVWLDLGLVARAQLQRAGVANPTPLAEVCTACHPERFFSVRREGPDTGRLVHWIAARPSL